jgi:hypothetical protein
MRYITLLLLLLPSSVTQAADACYTSRFAGSYAFQLSGLTNISGAQQPTTSLGRITFGDGGKVSGTSSIKLAGFLLGNPVTGSYEAHPDCTVTWQLQDDSGAYQHFSGRYTLDGIRVQFRQTDPGGVPGGIMIRTSDSCAGSDLKRKYSFTVSGSTTPMSAAQTARIVSGKGTIDTAREGDFHVDSDCAVHFTLIVPSADGQPASPLMTMRGFLVNGGKEILAFQPDPGAMVSARLIALP